MAKASPAPPARVASVDGYRGLVMFLMLAEVLELPKVAKAFPDSPVWRFLAHHQSHVEWAGCSLHDLIQPSFSFLVGVALPLSLANRAAGSAFPLRALRAAWRALLLVFLGVFLRSLDSKTTNWIFTDTLAQIGLGYFPLFLLAYARPRWQWLAFGVILVGYWAAFALYPVPSSGGEYAGFAAHWNKNANLASAFDRWFLNLFPRPEPFTESGGGYATLSFIPTLATMILGLIAGGWLREPIPLWGRVGRFALAGAAGLALGAVLDLAGVCPNVKRIWTPAWVLFSGGWCVLILAGFHGVMDVAGWQAWAYPLRVVGANSIVAYCMAKLFKRFIVESCRTHLGPEVFKSFGPEYEPLVRGAVILAAFWLILWWLYRQRIFVRI